MGPKMHKEFCGEIYKKELTWLTEVIQLGCFSLSH
jgi:hypothetical protein